MELPSGASISLEDVKRISDGLAAIAGDSHAPRSLSVTVTLHVHKEYPKQIGGKIVNSAEEEAATSEAK
jgi:hypothetical protein